MKGPFVPLSVSYRENDRMLGVEPLAELVFVRGLAFAKEKFSDGFIGRRQVRLLAGDLEQTYDVDGDFLINQLVTVGLWEVVPGGWVVEGWADWNALDSSRAGTLGNHERWHVRKGTTSPDCPHCDRGDSGATDGDIAPESGSASPSSQYRAETDHIPSSDERREDVDFLCDLLASLAVENGATKAKVTKAWRTEARRLLDLDNVPLSEAERVMRWALSDSFWRANVLSMPKFREKFDQLKLRANAARPTVDDQEYFR